MRTLDVAIIGDHDERNPTHIGTTAALRHTGDHLGLEVRERWVGTAGLEARLGEVTSADAVLVAPGSPYASMEGALAGITAGRSADLPLLGTCGGFQHLVIEIARSVLGIDAQHAESAPESSELFVTPLECSLVGTSGTVEIRPGSLAAQAYGGVVEVEERYYCSFGVAPGRVDDLALAGLVATGFDSDGAVRIMEVPAHPWCVATLFVPQLSSEPGRPHPLLVSWLGAAAG